MKQSEKKPFEEIVAVYGTLRPGFGNNVRTGLNTQEYLGIDTTKAVYKMSCNTGFPKIHLDGDLSITMSLFKVTSKDVWKNLDRLEGHFDGRKSGYHREKITLESGIEAWTYIYYGEPSKEMLTQGDWKLHKKGEYAIPEVKVKEHAEVKA